MYLMQIIRQYKLNSDNLEEVYDIVCKHFEEVELTKIALERLIWRKKYDAALKKEMEKVENELKDYLREQGDDDLGIGDFFK